MTTCSDVRFVLTTLKSGVVVTEWEEKPPLIFISDAITEIAQGCFL